MTGSRSNIAYRLYDPTNFVTGQTYPVTGQTSGTCEGQIFDRSRLWTALAGTYKHRLMLTVVVPPQWHDGSRSTDDLSRTSQIASRQVFCLPVTLAGTSNLAPILYAIACNVHFCHINFRKTLTLTPTLIRKLYKIKFTRIILISNTYTVFKAIR